MAIWNRLTTFVTGGAVATAASEAMHPEFEVLKQTAWRNEPHRVLDASTAAALRARESTGDVAGIDRQGVNLEDDSARVGVGSNRFDLLTELARRQPGLGELIRLQRRFNASGGKEGISPTEFRRLARRDGYTAATITALQDLIHDRLSPGELAAAIHRGLVPDPGLLQGEQPEPPFKVDAYPVYPINAVGEAEASGYDKDRLGVLVGLQGLPMGVIEAAHAYYRGIITHGDYIRAFNTSNSRNEWAEAVLQYAKQIPTARDFIENALRGYRSFDEAAAGAARHGMSRDDALTIFQNSGRPLNLKQISQALAWGAEYKPAPDDNPNPYRQAVLLGAVRPEYYDLQESLKYNLPSAFFFRVLQQQGVLTVEEAVVWYKRLGWPDDLARKVAEAFGTTTGAKADPNVAKAHTHLWTATHRSFVNGEIDIAEAVENLKVLGVGDLAQSEIIALWEIEREMIRKQLTPADIKKALTKSAVNAATGQPWTHDEALAALIARGYSPTDAQSYLNIPSGK